MTSMVTAHTRQTDIDALSNIGQTAQVVCEKLADLANKVEKVSGIRGGSLMVDNTWKVDASDYRLKLHYDCKFPPCSFKLGGPRMYTITNIESNESVEFDEADLHLMECHHYFPKGGSPVDPLKACSVLNITSEKRLTY